MNDIIIISLQSLTAKSAAGAGKLCYYLSTHFHQKNRLNKYIVSSKGTFTTDFPSAPVSFFSRYYLFVLNSIWKVGLLKYYQKRFLEEWFFDFFLRFQITSACKILVSVNPYIPKTLHKCKRLGIKTFFISTNPEENEINARLNEVRSQWGVNKNETDVYTYSPRMKIYNSSVAMFDKILAYTSVVENSYLKRHQAQKVSSYYGFIWAVHENINQSKIKHALPSEGFFKVSYLAHTVLLKGLQDLLEAWSRMNTDNAALHIGGGMDPVIKNIIQSRFSNLKNVIYHGHVKDVNDFLSETSLFVCPSIIDAGPATVLEAAAKAIPSIITGMCGTLDIFENNVSVFIVPPSSPAKLATVLEWCKNNPKEIALAGQRAAAIINGQSLDEFITGFAKMITVG